MGSNLTLGTAGEEMACSWLLKNGYNILHRNWRHRHYEIDIVTEKDNQLHFIEVKCRNYSPFGHPEDSVTRKKFKSLQKAVDEYLFLHPGHQWIQYDILSITLDGDKAPEFFLLEDVFL